MLYIYVDIYMYIYIICIYLFIYLFVYLFITLSGSQKTTEPRWEPLHSYLGQRKLSSRKSA